MSEFGLAALGASCQSVRRACAHPTRPGGHPGATGRALSPTGPTGETEEMVSAMDGAPSADPAAVPRTLPDSPAGTAVSSTVVLVLTDVEGSTRLWAEHPHLMYATMARHHQIVHRAITAHGGWRPVDQGEGDAVFAAFDAAAPAVAAVVRFQRELADEPWPPGIEIRVRVGIHAGEVLSRDGNLFGSAVNRCARLRGLGAGCQVLLSAPAFELVRDQLPAGVTVVDLGEHRMKDLARPERVHQLVIPGLPAGFPPLASLDRADHNLPIQTSSFLGRQREVAELVELLRTRRLVTIVGFGGMGKTRLALQVAAELALGDGDGVWFVDLSAVTDAARVASQIATTLGVVEGVDGPLPALIAAIPAEEPPAGAGQSRTAAARCGDGRGPPAEGRARGTGARDES